MNLRVDILGPLIDWLVGVMTVIGALCARIAVALTNIFPPIPSEVILPLAVILAVVVTWFVVHRLRQVIGNRRPGS